MKSRLEPPMRTFLVALLGALLAAPAAATNTTTFPDEPYYSKGVFENFRELYVEPAEFVKSLKPVAPATSGPATGDLVVRNDTIGFIYLQVNGTEVGVLTPMMTGILHDLPAGQYDVALRMANGFVETRRVSTTAPAQQAEPPAAPVVSGPVNP